jgi:hypothetical protein
MTYKRTNTCTTFHPRLSTWKPDIPGLAQDNNKNIAATRPLVSHFPIVTIINWELFCQNTPIKNKLYADFYELAARHHH